MWNYEYNERLRLAVLPKGGSAADKGTSVHALLDKYYHFKALNPTTSSYVAMDYSKTLFNESKLNYKLGFDKEWEEFLLQRFTEYVQFYQGNDFKVAKTNLLTGTELGFSKILYENDKIVIIIEGRIDLLVEDSNFGLCFVDHKSQTKFSDLFDYKVQFTTYAWAAETKYGIINYFGLTQKFDGFNTFRRQVVQFQPHIIERWKTKVIEVALKIANNSESWEEVKFQNIDHCAGAFDSHPCQYWQLCIAQNQGIRESLKKSQFIAGENWTPWT